MPKVDSDIDAGVAELMALRRRDYGPLAARIKRINHSVSCTVSGVNFHLHYPSFRQGSATVPELVTVIVEYLTAFSLPRAHIEKVHSQYGKISAHEFEIACGRLKKEAVSLFKRAQQVTGRNGESGELLLYLFCEWILEAPQFLAKMSLKTDSQMPVHGSDGIHLNYDEQTGELLVYWGESKLYANVTDAVNNAISSIKTALDPNEIQYECDLIGRHIDLSGFSSQAKTAILKYLDPFDDSYNKRRDVITCMIGFDSNVYTDVAAVEIPEREKRFAELVEVQLSTLAPKVAEALVAAGISDHSVELFFLPLPSVQVLRDLFQSEIGWNN